MNIPATKKTIPELWEIYTTRLYLTRKDIEAIFGIGTTYAGKLKQIAKAREKELGLTEYSRQTVRTHEAFITWGIDPAELKRRAKENTK